MGKHSFVIKMHTWVQAAVKPAVLHQLADMVGFIFMVFLLKFQYIPTQGAYYEEQIHIYSRSFDILELLQSLILDFRYLTSRITFFTV